MEFLILLMAMPFVLLYYTWPFFLVAAFLWWLSGVISPDPMAEYHKRVKQQVRDTRSVARANR